MSLLPASAQPAVSGARAESHALVESAQASAATGRFDDAARLFERAIALDDANLAAYLGLSAIWLASKQHERALQLLRVAEQRLGWSAALGTQRGLHLAASGKRDLARSELARAVAADARAYDAAYALGELCIASADWTCAARALRDFLAARPATRARDDAAVQLRIAYCELQAGRPRDAEHVLDALLRDHPRDAAARVLVTTVYAQTGRCHEALDKLAGLATQATAIPEIHYNRALCLARVGRNDDALAALADYARLRPTDGRAALLRARVHEAAGRHADALVAYRAAIAAGVAATDELAGVLARTGRHREALDLVWPLVEKGGASVGVLAMAAEAALALHDRDKARTATTALSARAPADARSHELLGRVELLVANHDAAAAAFERALALDARDSLARRGLVVALVHHARAALARGDRTQARARLARARAVDPTSAIAAHDLAALELSDGNAQQALSVLEPFRAAIARDPRLGGVLAAAHEATGDVAGARALWLQLSEAAGAPEVRAHALLALATLDRATDRPRALARLDQARPLARDPAVAARIDELAAAIRIEVGEAELRAGRIERAAEQFALAERARDPALAARARFGTAIVVARALGFARAMAILDAIPEDALTAAFDPFLERGARVFARQYIAYLALEVALYRSRRAALAGPVPVVARQRAELAVAVQAALLDRMLHDALAARQPAIAELVAGDARAGSTRTFRHNAAVRRGTARLTAAETAQLQALERDLPEARINLALAAHARGADTEAEALLRGVDPKLLAAYQLQPWLELREHLK
jgi:tetratricopeptide (TPR) repeat protein